MHEGATDNQLLRVEIDVAFPACYINHFVDWLQQTSDLKKMMMLNNLQTFEKVSFCFHCLL